MTLTEYIKNFPCDKRCAMRKHIAHSLHISEVYVRSMCNGHKKIPAKYALAIEQLTQGQVSRHTIAPDFYPVER